MTWACSARPESAENRPVAITSVSPRSNNHKLHPKPSPPNLYTLLTLIQILNTDPQIL